jgi:hypothetical protein
VAWVVAGVLTSGVAGGAASAQPRADPQRGIRMAVTDEASAAGLQPRVWVRTLAGNLRAKQEFVVAHGWAAFSKTRSVTSGLAGVSHFDTQQRERAFYVSAGRLRMAGFDDGIPSAEIALPNPSGMGTTIDGADVGAVTWIDGGRRGTTST